MEYITSILWLITIGLTSYLIFPRMKNKKSNDKKLPPGPFPLPLFGNLFHLGRKPHKALAELAKTYGPVMTVRLGSQTAVIISSKSMAQEVLQSNDLLFSNRFKIEAFCVLDTEKNSMIVLPASARWRFLRKIIHMNVFTTAMLDSGQQLRELKVNEMIYHVRKSSELSIAVDIYQVAFTTTLNLLSSTFFSMDLADLSSSSISDFRELTRKIFSMVAKPNVSDFLPFLKPLDLQGIKYQTGTILKNIHDIFGTIITQRLQTRKSTSYKKNDVLDELLDISEENDKDFKQSNIPYLLTDLFVAGTEATARNAEWVMAELLRNPEKLKKAQEETDMVIGKGNHITEAVLPKLSYLQLVIKETMRLHPTTPFLVPRKANEDVELRDFVVPKGAQVWVNAWNIGRDPSIWKDPDSFEPERFSGSEVDFKGKHFELLPFGAGRRMCPGIPLVSRVLPLMVGSLIHFYDWELENGAKPESLNMDDKFSFSVIKAQP